MPYHTLRFTDNQLRALDRALCFAYDTALADRDLAHARTLGVVWKRIIAELHGLEAAETHRRIHEHDF